MKDSPALAAAGCAVVLISAGWSLAKANQLNCCLPVRAYSPPVTMVKGEVLLLFKAFGEIPPHLRL